MSWLNALVLPEAADPIVLDLGVSNVRIEGRPLPDGNWLAIAGYSYNGLCGDPPLDSIIGSYDTADEAIAAGVVKVREGAEIVLAPGFGNDVTAALGEGGKAGAVMVRRKNGRMKHDQIVDALEAEIRYFRASAPMGSEAAERVLKLALRALDYYDKEEMFDEYVRLKHLRLGGNQTGKPLS